MSTMCAVRYERVIVELGEAPQLTVQSNAIPSLELRDLERAIGKLPTEQREVILLVGLEGMAYEEVATVLNVPVGTVRSRLSRGRDQLRRLMGVHQEEDSERLHAA
jgi:RNA polymerase sigma-70 factor, ECF subfamily